MDKYVNSDNIKKGIKTIKREKENCMKIFPPINKDLSMYN